MLLRILCRCLGGDSGEPGIEPRNGIVELAGDRGFAVCGRARQLIDLARDGIQPLMNVRHVAVILARDYRLRWIRYETASVGAEPIVAGYAGALRGSVRTLAIGWFDSVVARRSTRIHAFVQCRPRKMRPHVSRACLE
jgi:hypothetical protein